MGLIERQTAIEAIAYSIELCNKALDSMTLGGRDRYAVEVERNSLLKLKDDFKLLPSAQLEYEPVTAEDFAKTMSENTLYNFMAWHGVALELMERHGFVICKKTM